MKTGFKKSKTVQVVMLPTDKPSTLVKLTGKLGSHLMIYEKSRTVQESDGFCQQFLYVVTKDDIKRADDYVLFGKDNHLCRIIKIYKEGNCDLRSERNIIELANIDALRKVLATTDTNILPKNGNESNINFEDLGNNIKKIPASFVEAYAKSNGNINEIDIDVIEHVEEDTTKDYVEGKGQPCIVLNEVETRDDNTIIIRKSQKFTKMDICRAYNAGKQNGIDSVKNSDNFMSSDEYFEQEFGNN